MNQHQIRQAIIDAMNEEANNGIWQNWEHGNAFIFCVSDVKGERGIGQLVGIITVLKGYGKVTVAPYSDDADDDGSYIKVTITPR